MPAVLVFCEVSGSTVRSASLPALTAARALAPHHGGQVIAVLIGQGVGAAAADAARYASRVLAFDDARLAAPLA